MGRLGIGDETHVVTYASANHWWGTRLWWMLRVFGHDRASVLDGGSLFWVIRGIIRVRHRILRLDDVTDADGHEYCAIIYDPKVILVEPRPRRAFQGWRYLEADDSPPDLPNQRQALANVAAEGDMPAVMLAELRTLGLF